LPGLVLLVILGLAVAACAGGSGTGSASSGPATASPGPSTAEATPVTSDAPGSSTPSSEPTAIASADASTSASPSASGTTMLVRAYFVLGGQPGATGLVPVLRTVPQATTVASAAMTALLAGPTKTESANGAITTAIPDGTTVSGITIKNGIATVDLSSAFASEGGAASVRYRLAQVVYTLTQFSNVRSVVFKIDGQTANPYGSKGIVLDGPSKRADWTDQLPAIFVDRPAYNAAIGNPGPVSGNADVFEATFRVAVLDGSGKVLVDQQATASCGSGCRGTFQQTVTYRIGKAQWGTLRVYDPSAKDGSPQSVRDYRVWLTPRP
jgi:spore germination protein GerM